MQPSLGASDPHMHAMPDLFELPLMPGLSSREDVMSRAKQAALIAAIDAQPLQPFVFQGWLGKRLTHSFGWHRDRPMFDHVIGLSLGAPATLRLRQRRGERFERADLPLPPRSIYHLSGAARQDWEHSIMPLDEPRWSAIFRSFVAGFPLAR